MPDTKLRVAQLVAVFVECIFYGIYLVTFIASLQAILWSGPLRTWPSRLKSNRSMLTAVLSMFVFSTLNLALGLVRILQGVIYNTRSGGGAVEQLGLNWVNIVKPLTVNLQIMVADTVLIYRCWVVYNKSWQIVIFPIFLWLAGLACTTVNMYTQGMLTSGSRVNGGILFAGITAFWTATMTLNLYATTMIVIRIWRVVNQAAITHKLSPFASEQPQSRLQNIMRIIVESGLVYTVVTIVVFVSHVTGSNSIYITTAAEMQIIGITFNLILIRPKNASDSTIGAGDHTEHGISFASPAASKNHETANNITINSMTSGQGSIDVEKAAKGSLKEGRDVGTRHTF
ncbi:hypothetical protein FPV67DRAFT_1668910 [Lyophyllum atratum]|nr:hypothetical protein FPV67DRAFT_1668910 [Lyophyllum atratum]